MLSESLTVLILSLVHMAGVILGYWIRGQLAAAHEMAMAVPRKEDKMKMPSAEEEVAQARRIEADIRKKMASMNLPVPGDD